MGIKEYIKRLNTWIGRQTIHDSVDIVATNDGAGWSLSFREPPSGEGSGGGDEATIVNYQCKITGGTTLSGYSVDVYGDGYDESSTDSGTCDALPLAVGSDLPTGYPLLLMSSSVSITGGNDE